MVLSYLKRTQSEKYYNIIVQDKPLLPLSLFPNCTEFYVLFDYQCNVIMKAFTFISIGFSFVFRCKNNPTYLIEYLSSVAIVRLIYLVFPAVGLASHQRSSCICKKPPKAHVSVSHHYFDREQFFCFKLKTQRAVRPQNKDKL